MVTSRHLAFSVFAFAALSSAALSSAAISSAHAQTSGDPVVIGVSGPLTGPNAQYGAQWKKGFDLAIDEINQSGGIKGRPLAYDFQDSQNDPRQTVTIAQKFVNDPRITVEVGDFSSTASMAASPIYQRAGLVQFGFTNSHPNFTKTGDYIWSNSISQAEDSPQLADYAVKRLGLKKLAVLHLNTDWGKSSSSLFEERAKADGATILDDEGYLPDERDFRSTLVRVRDAHPDGVILISYYADGALIARQARENGIAQPLVGIGSIYSPKFPELAGAAGNGVYTQSEFFPEDSRPVVQDFVKKFRARYNQEPDAFNAYAYDTVILLATVARQYGATREDIKNGLAKVRDVPSVIFTKATFDTETRRVKGAKDLDLQVRDGKFVAWDGKPAVAP